MALLPKGTFSGNYPPSPIDPKPDVRFILEFSHRPEELPPGLPNIELAQRLEEAEEIEGVLPNFASHSIVRALEYIRSDVKITRVFEGPSASGMSENTGTYGELEQGMGWMAELGYSRPEIITSGYNIGNVVLQAVKLGMNPIVPDKLPCSFDPRSDQPWTRNWSMWVGAAIPRIYKLRKSGH